jgi:two-component system, NarL family, response regulator NreC
MRMLDAELHPADDVSCRVTSSTPQRLSGPVRLHLAPNADADAAADADADADAASSASTERTIRVVLADDHALMRRNLRLLLDNARDVEVVAEVEDLTAVASKLRRHQPHVLVLDLGMLNGSSVETIRLLRERVPGTEIVILTMDDSAGVAQRALDAGAVGFVLKDLADSELGPAVRSAAQGHEYLSPVVAARLEALRRSVVGDRLTSREIEVLRLTALGHTGVEVARKLDLSRRTVETHRARIGRKLGLGTRAELVRYALGCGLLSTRAGVRR